MTGKRDRPDEIVTRLRKVEGLKGYEMAVAYAVQPVSCEKDRWNCRHNDRGEAKITVSD